MVASSSIAWTAATRDHVTDCTPIRAGRFNLSDAALPVDRAYAGDETQASARALGHEPIVPPQPNRAAPWRYDRERNCIARLCRR